MNEWNQMLAMKTLLTDMAPAKPKLTDAAIHQLYQYGMHFANALRVVGRAEDAHDMEVWVLALQDELAQDQRILAEHARAEHASDLEDFDGRTA
jgi:hypothetical protein